MHPVGRGNLQDDCDMGGQAFDEVIHERAKDQKDNKPLAQLQFDRQREQPEVQPICNEPVFLPEHLCPE